MRIIKDLEDDKFEQTISNLPRKAKESSLPLWRRNPRNISGGMFRSAR
jgi:hypothetical protein